MNKRTPEMQSAIDIEYKRLQGFDPEIRNGLIERHFHTDEEKKSIRKCTEVYNTKCLEFRDFCESIVLNIIEAPPPTLKQVLEKELLTA
jgi:hypothetical protein